MKTVFAFAALVASVAFASEPVVCTLTTSTGAAASTAACTTGSATWIKGSVVLLQCTSDVYVSSTTPSGTTTVNPATSSMELLDFSTSKDKVLIPLNPQDLHISVLAASSAGTCKFMTSLRKRPSL